MKPQVYGDEILCPKCGDLLTLGVDVGGGYKHDVCLMCGFKRKKNLAGQLVDKVGELIVLEQKDEQV